MRNARAAAHGRADATDEPPGGTAAQ